MGMALSFFRKREKAPLVPKGPAGKRCYAIGDVHGRLDLLRDLMRQIQADATGLDRDIVIVFLGDLIDRGPESRQVLDFVRADPVPGARLVFIKGNHEEMFVRGLTGEPAVLPNWLDYGGYECAQSYGVEVGALFGRTAEEIESVLLPAVPRGDVDFVSSFIDSARFGDYLLVHAGVRPGIPVDEQSPRDLRWIRAGFLDSDEDLGFVTVHGHSICPEVEVKSNRISVDTGAYATGVLTAVWLDGEQRGILQAKGEPGPKSHWLD